MKLKTIDIRGKSYVMVHERIRAFHELYPKGAIKTEVIRQTDTDILMVSKVYPDAVDSNKYFTGHAFEKNSGGMVNSTSHVENAETSAVGRALGFLGIGVETSIATAEEVSNAIKQQEPEIKVYTYNGVKYPHVTAILNPDPLPIPEWHKAVGTQVDLILKAFFAGKGHPINKEGLPPDALKNLDECTEAIQDWLIAFGDKFSDTTFDTRVINHQDVYIGTEDMEAVYEGQYSLIDFKKTKNLDKKMTAHYFMQMAAYAKAQRFDNKERKPIEQLVIASPFNDPVVTTDIDKYYALFLEKRAEFKKRFKL